MPTTYIGRKSDMICDEQYCYSDRARIDVFDESYLKWEKTTWPKRPNDNVPQYVD